MSRRPSGAARRLAVLLDDILAMASFDVGRDRQPDPAQVSLGRGRRPRRWPTSRAAARWTVRRDGDPRRCRRPVPPAPDGRQPGHERRAVRRATGVVTVRAADASALASRSPTRPRRAPTGSSVPHRGAVQPGAHRPRRPAARQPEHRLQRPSAQTSRRPGRMTNGLPRSIRAGAGRRPDSCVPRSRSRRPMDRSRGLDRSGGRSRDRTCDHLVVSEVLYR